jgi:cell pole-organizing protein PopZ
MAEAKTEQEPSIEEILESIRQIISEDGDAPAQASSLDLSAKPAPAPQPSSLTLQGAEEKKDTSSFTLKGQEQPQDDDDILDLTDEVVPPAINDMPIEIDLREISDEPPQGGDISMTDQADKNNDAALLSDVTADAATAAMAKLLSANIAVEHDEPTRLGKVTLEDMARELLRPLIKSWLDQNLPKVVEKVVAKEIEKLSRRALDQ